MDRPPEHLIFLNPMTTRDAELLYNLLCDNARSWNADLRRQLGNVIIDTEAFNARVDNPGG